MAYLGDIPREALVCDGNTPNPEGKESRMANLQHPFYHFLTSTRGKHHS